MLRRAWFVGLLAVVSAALCSPDGKQANALAAQPAGNETKKWTFDTGEPPAGWTITGDAAIDATKGRQGKGGSLRIGPGAKALLTLRGQDASGKVEIWVYDDLTTPQNPKASRVGPRWGLLQGDGKLLAVGILYASYLGGNEGYTATACDGKDWFDRLFWLGVNRKPAGWHKWTFDFDAEAGLQVLHNDKELGAVDPGKTGLQGFRAIAIWGDNGKAGGQTIWVDDVSVTLGGPTKLIVPAEADPYDEKSLARDTAALRPAALYAKQNPPATPKLEDLPLVQGVSQYGVTWRFDKPARVGQFVNGDWYVVGPATVSSIDPRPLYGKEIPRRELDGMDRERPEGQRVRNGLMLNPPAQMKVAYDSGVRNWFDPALIQKLPVAMKPGDSLVSTISMPKGLVLHAQLRNKIERGVDDSSPIRTAAVLSCVGRPQPPDAFRPAFCDRRQKIYLARDLKRDLLPVAARTKSTPKIEQYIRFTQRPWVGTCFFGFEEPVENMPQYGLEYGRVAGISALLLCTDLKPEEKEPLLVNYVQVGIDLGGMVRAGHPGWTGFGGHGSGRKLPIVFAGLLLGDEQLAHVNRSFPKTSFGEDEQTAYGDCWTGAKVVFAGHSGIDAATGVGRDRGNAWGPYEHKPPSQWQNGQKTSESYRRCCTSVGWVAQALALRLMHAEKAWNHDAFFDYADRWMSENDAQFVKTIKRATGQDYDKHWARQGQAWDAFTNEMWAAHRAALPAPADGWKQPHDDSYYRRGSKQPERSPTARDSIAARGAAAAALDPARLAEIRPRMQKFVDRGEISGAVTLVGRHDRVVSLEAVGYGDLAAKAPMRPDTIFRIASMTKPITAAGIMILVDEGKLAIEDPVEKHLPEFRGMQVLLQRTKDGVILGKPSRPIAVRDLLTHTSGMPGGLPAELANLYLKRDRTLAEAVRAFAQRPLEFEPGTKWAYCNLGIDTLGRIIEVASGQSYETFLEERIFRPLGMVDTSFYPKPAQAARIAVTYGVEQGKLVPAKGAVLGPPAGAKYPIPAGGLYSTAADLAKFYRMTLNGGSLEGRRILSPASLSAMTRLQTRELTTGFTPGMGFGLGFAVVRTPGGITAPLSPGSYGHGGAFGTQGWIDPAKDLFVVLMIQRVGLPNADASDMRRELQSIAFGSLGK